MLIGPRQVGKSTMLEHLMEGTPRRKVSLDDLSERKLAQEDPALFLELHPAPVLVDEVQYAPELFSYIKIAIDRINTTFSRQRTHAVFSRKTRINQQESLPVTCC